jgi:predicted ATP-grasp superfamily ATP-dependent carboligase
MRIFLYEYTCAVADATLPASLRAEGRAMLSAVVEDFAQVPGVTVCTLQPSGAEEAAFRRLARQADFTLVIGPETDDLLLRRCQWVREAGGRLLGPAPEAVRLAADKLALAQHLQHRQVPTPSTVMLADARDIPWSVVLKPRFGAGSQATFLIRRREELEECVLQASQESGATEMVLQPFVVGQPASVAFLVGPGGRVPLLPAEQHLSADGRFRYLGGRAPLPAGLAERAQRLGERAVAAVGELRGYVGVDLVLGEAADGSQDWIIEINPRLTTSYIGLRHLARGNLAEAMLRATQGLPLSTLTWHGRAVEFRADGKVQVVGAGG